MAGHSHSANIAVRKGKQDAVRAKLFSKLTRYIMIAARNGGGDPDTNLRLRYAILKARSVSMPKDIIERGIKKGTGDLEGVSYEEITYEGYGPHGVGVMVECQTDNRNRTAPEVRLMFKSNNGNLGETGSVAWMFDRVCQIEATKAGEFDPEEEAIEAGANEVHRDESSFTFYGSPEELDAIRAALGKRGWTVVSAELSFKAKNPAQLNEEQKKEVVALLSELDEHDDSHRVHATLEE